MTRIYGKPGFCFIKDIERVSWEKIQALGQYPVSIIGDGLGRRSIMDSGIKPLNPDIKLFGSAVTVEVRSGDNLMIHVALKIAQKGDVLVINTNGDLQYGVWGEITTRVAMKKGLAGVVFDGSVRDSDFISKSGFPLYCRGICPCGGGKEGTGQVNFPISCGGVAVHPGDVIVGDGDGIVVVPKDMVDIALKGAQERTEVEAKRIAGIEEGILYPSFLLPKLRQNGLIGETEEI